MPNVDRVHVIDSHTEGEPTRVVIEGGPDLGEGSWEERVTRFRDEFDGFRRFVVNEPRGFDAMVGALLLPPLREGAAAGVLYFNNVGPLHMCVHGTIGVAVTLAELGRIEPGRHGLETPVGDVIAHLHDDGSVSVENVPSWRERADVEIETPSLGTLRGDLAWGGNWFFLVKDYPNPLRLERLDVLRAEAMEVRRALVELGLTTPDGREIDHVEFFGPPERADADSKNFVLCPGGEYDRSPCGTGTSAKIACLAAEGRLAPDAEWRQESIIGSRFVGRYRSLDDGRVLPTIRGRAWITGEATLRRTPGDPYAEGIAP